MTPLLTYLQDQLLAAQLPGLSRDTLTLYFADAHPAYTLPYDPDGKLMAGSAIELELTPPATLVFNPFTGDLLDLILTINLLLDDLAPATRGNDKRLTISAEPLSATDSIVVITLKLRERIRYVPDVAGNLTINGTHYRREALQLPPMPIPLNEIRYVES